MTRPRLLMLVTEDWYFASHRLALACAAVADGFDVAVISRFGNLKSEIERAGIRAIPYAFDRRGVNPLRAVTDVLRLARLIRRERPDIVHNVALKPVILGGLACRLTGTMHVVNAIAGMGFLFTDGRRAPLSAAIVRSLLAIVGRRGVTVVQNPDDRRLLLDVGVPADAVRIMPGVGVDLDEFRETPEPAGTPIVVLPARLLLDKGVREFVEAARILKERRIQVRCVLVGSPDDGNPTSVPQWQLDAWLAKGVVEWWGHSVDMAATLSSAHIVCLPSYREGFPKVLAESAACGRPIVTTEVPGCRSVVTHMQNGLLVPPKDPKRLATAIEELACNSMLRRRLGAAGRLRAERDFSVQSATLEMLNVYRVMLGKRAA